jgi:hypothetical protein
LRIVFRVFREFKMYDDSLIMLYSTSKYRQQLVRVTTMR